MSYSFSVKKPTKLGALGAVTLELGKIAQNQPVHKIDMHQVQAAASAFVTLLADDDTCDVQISVNGSIYKPDSPGVVNVSCSITCNRVPRESQV